MTALVLVSGGVFSPLTSGYIIVMSVAGSPEQARLLFLRWTESGSVFGIALLQTGGLTLPVLIDFQLTNAGGNCRCRHAFTAVLLFYLAVSNLSDALARGPPKQPRIERSSNLRWNNALNARTERLHASADVGRAAVSILDTNQLLREIVNLITDRFGFYYTAVFLADGTNKWAVLREATGEAGRVLKERKHQLEIGGQSMVGTAMKTRKARIALDVGDEAVRFANPLLPDTRSEIALPLVVGTRVIGALDVQSTQMAAFDEASAAVLQSMADQIAIALSNTLQFQQAQTTLQRTRQTIRNQHGHLQRRRCRWRAAGTDDSSHHRCRAAQILTYGPLDEAGQVAYLEVAASWAIDDSVLGCARMARACCRNRYRRISASASEPYVVRDAADPSVPPAQQQIVQAMGMRAMLGYALVAGSQPVGLLLIVVS